MLEMKTELLLNLWTKCSHNIHRVKVLFTCSGITLNVWDNTLKLDTDWGFKCVLQALFDLKPQWEHSRF